MMFLLVCQLGYLAAGVKTGLAGFADFRAFYGAGAIVRMGAGARLYEYELQHQVQNERVGERTAALPFVYPGYAALPFAAVTGLGYRTAYWVFLGVNVVLLGVAVWLMLPWLQGLTAVWRGLPWMVFGCFYPVAVALLQGQVSVALLVIVCGCFAAMERGRMFLAGAVLALGLVKFHVVLPVALLFCWWRRWRFVGGFAAGAAGVGLACLWVTGWAGMVSYARLVVTAAGTGSVGAALDDSMRNSGRMPNLHGLVFAMAGDARWGTVVVGVLSVGVLVWTARQGASLGRAVVAGLLVSYHLHLHDVSLLLLPLGLALNGMSLERVRSLWVRGATVFWMVSPVLVWVAGMGWNFVLAVTMIPFLVRWERDKGDGLEAKT
ncbi:glycosyltransferase family 87 protein [Granulicella tundricola]|nr:glycosyltransferase family 87 protein [Granulicella tundricola]